MKIRSGFVSNSSSTAFIITNLSDQAKSILDFAMENIALLDEFNESYGDDITREDFMASVCQEHLALAWKPKESKYCIFGDESGTVVGRVYDYILRDGGKSENFEWHFEESLR